MVINMNELILDINKVDGFDPSQYLRTFEGDKNETYLDVKFRILWFRAKYPNGKIDVEVLQADFVNGVAIVQAKIYADKNDPPEQFLAKALGQRFRSADEYGDRFVEFAETSAIGRALSDSGFGTQFCNTEDVNNEPDVVDAPVDIKVTEKKEKQESDEPVKVPRQRKVVEKPKELSFDDSKSKDEDEELKKVILEAAKNTVVDFGKHKGKQLKEIAILEPGYIDWIINSDFAKEPLKKAANVLINAASQQIAS